MKKFIFSIVASFFLALPASAQENINLYDVTLYVEEDGTLHVQEQIDYDFGENERHGIYRDIPYVYKKGFGRYKLQIQNVQVTNENEKEYTFIHGADGNNYQIKIGDPNATINGLHTYNIFYSVKGAHESLQTFDQINWNAIGTGWAVSIDEAKVMVFVPQSMKDKFLGIECFRGEKGSGEGCESALNGQLIDGHYAYSFTTKELYPYEGVTTQIKFQSGTFPGLSTQEKLKNIVANWWPVLLPLSLFTLLFHKWKKTGRDPKGKGTIITQFDAPDSLTPAEVGTLFDEKAHSKDISAEIVHLAILGYIRIVRNEKKGLFGKETYTLEKLKPQHTLNNPFQALLIQHLFGSNSGDEKVLARVNLEDLKDTFAKKLQELQDKVYEALVQKGYFPKNPNKTRTIYYAFSVVPFALSIVFLGFAIDYGYYVLFFSFLLCGVMLCIAAPLMSAKSQKGVDAHQHILGLKNYLSVAEKDRINFHNAPEKKPEIFERLLPFAMVLGVEKAWAKQFEGIYNQNPTWYSSPGYNAFSAINLTNSLGSFSSTTSSSLSSTPSSSGGGGFSGGGFGGGGGGSW